MRGPVSRTRLWMGLKGVSENKPAEENKTEEKVEESLEKAVENLTVEDPVAQPVEQPTVGETVATETVAEPVTETKTETPAESTETTQTPATTSAPSATETLEPAKESAPQTSGEKVDESIDAVEEASEDEASDDEGGWITPSNLKKHQNASSGAALPSAPVQKTLQAAVLTSDYAMQNVALRMNLNLVAPSLVRITHLKNWVLRCHGCFKITKEMDKQFCPSCGQPTLNRVSCSTDEQGNFKVHLKKNFQWNNRGNVYSVPKPVHGSSNGRLAKYAGGQNNWGTNLILAEDQKEFTRAADEQRRQKKKDIMDQDYLPDILTGHRAGGGGKIRVGAGRNVNSKKKH